MRESVIKFWKDWMQAEPNMHDDEHLAMSQTVKMLTEDAEEIQRLRDAASGLSNLLTKRNEEIHRLRNTLKRVMHWQSSLTLPASIKEEAENLLLEQEE